jgi:hypothetical protein
MHGAAARLEQYAIDDGDVRGDAVRFASAVRAAREAGTSESEISETIDGAEEVVVGVCDACYDILEDAR